MLQVSRNTVNNIVLKAKLLGLNRQSDPGTLETISGELEQQSARGGKKPKTARDKLISHHEQIKEWLNAPYMTIRQIKRLLSEKPFYLEIGESSLHRYIKGELSDQKKSTMVLPTIPGEHAQVDFGFVGLLKDPCTGNMKRAYAFVMTLSHSRYRFVYFVFKQKSSTWVDCHRQAMESFSHLKCLVYGDS